MRLRPRDLLIAFGLATTLAQPSASAEPPSEDAAAVGESLLQSGRAAMEHGNLEVACERFAEAHRLSARIDALDALATCREGQGRTATAWALLQDAERLAITQHDTPRAAALHQRVALLEPRVPHLTIVVTYFGAPPAVRRDGKSVAPVRWGLSEAVDPGEHVLEVDWAQADTRSHVTKRWRVDLAPGQSRTIDLGGLGGPTSGAMQRVAGYALGGLGAALVVGGLVLRAGTKSKYDRAAATCNDAPHPNGECTPASLALTSDAQSEDSLGAFAIGGGAALLIGGVALVLTAPKAPVVAAPSVSAHGGGLTLRGAF